MNPSQGIMLAIKVSLIANVVLFMVKAVALVIVDSLAIMADLGISIVALAISLLLYHALKMADRPADLFHNYGYGKIENVCEAIEGVILIGIALAMSIQAVMHLVRISPVNAPLAGLTFSAVGMIINFWGAHFILQQARLHASPALHAEGVHFRLEGFISLTITLAFALVLIFSSCGWNQWAHYVDPIATLVVSLAITIPSLRLLREAFLKLLDASIGEASQMDVIKVLAKHYHRYCTIKDIKTRTAGRRQFVDIRLVMPDHLSVKKAHLVATAIREDLLTAIPYSDVLVHVDPCERNCVYASNQQGLCPYIMGSEGENPPS